MHDNLARKFRLDICENAAIDAMKGVMIPASTIFARVVPIDTLPFGYDVITLPKTRVLVHTSLIIATQRNLHADTLAWLDAHTPHLSTPAWNNTDYTHPIIVANDHDQLYLLDGHHRVATALQRHEPTIHVMMVDTCDPRTNQFNYEIRR